MSSSLMPGDALQHQRLEDRGVEPAVGLGLAGERAVERACGVLEAQPEAAAVMGVEEPKTPMPSSPAGSSSSVGDLVDLEELAQPVAERLLALGVVGEAGEQAVGGEDRQARVVERGQRHQRVVVRRPRRRPRRGRRARSRSGGGRRRSGARRRRGSSCDGGVDLGVGDPPDAGAPCRRRRSTSPQGSAADRRLDLRPGVAGGEGEDRREVVAGGAGEVEPVLLRPGLGALVRADLAGP